ncbi:GumC family protein [Flavimarina sp. Hel_I_48]|uniref:GumC family protein n=1 Tax=Flavimarina sp. Hel_I_48 TaxID=1392488 RepID=UPI0006923B71|nr:polysaccharide biosynthesis tyrosine autokinase [Flavimarina sp. Hel_I_48]
MPLKESTPISRNTKPKEYSINLREAIFSYLRKWPWFILSLIIFVGLAYTYLRYSIPKYSVYSTILIDTEDGPGASELAVFQDLGYTDQAQNKIENEIQIIRSRSIMNEVVKKLNLNVQHFSEGNVIKTENYPEGIVKINFLASDSLIYTKSKTFHIKIKSKTKFELANNSDEKGKIHSFGKKITTSIGDIILTPSAVDIENYIDKEVEIRVLPLLAVSENYRNKINIGLMEKSPSVLKISLSDPVEEKARDIVNTLIKTYNGITVENNKSVASKTASFINDRIALITSDLSAVDTDAAQFKASRGLGVDINSQAQRMAESNLQASKEIASLSTELEIISSIKNTVSNQGRSYQIIPGSLGFSDPSVNSIISRYNDLVLVRDRLLEGATEQNPNIVNLDQQLGNLKSSLISSLGNLEQSTRIKLNSIQAQNEGYSSKIYSAPQQQQALNEIERQSNVKEQIYVYLLQKREEAEISSGVPAPNAKIIDPAIVTRSGSISPPRNVIYGGAVAMALFLPFLFIYVGSMLNVKVQTREDLEKVLSTPIIGDIPRAKRRFKGLISTNDRSPLAESFRILKTNLNFLMTGSSADKGKIIFLTSTISGEGKTFISANLAKTLSSSGKRVLLLGADLRDPKLHEIFDLPQKKNTLGLTSYLTDSTIEAKDMILKDLNKDMNFDLIPSGPIPPNPAELLESSKMRVLMEYLKNTYDYVIVDTAPVHLVTDTLLISKFSDTIIYVVRANYLDKRLLPVPESLYQEKRLRNMAVLLNDTNYEAGYGYGYGYGYGK